MLIVGIGGTTRPRSSSEAALTFALRTAEARGASTVLVEGAALAELPMYDATVSEAERHPTATRMIEAVRQADGVIIASPGYHGSIAGVVKNALDYLEDLREDERPYLDGRPVGCVATGSGWQAVVTTLQALRMIVHALRGWPTPLGVGINSSGKIFADDGDCVDDRVRVQLEAMTDQVVSFGDMAARLPGASLEIADAAVADPTDPREPLHGPGSKP